MKKPFVTHLLFICTLCILITQPGNVNAVSGPSGHRISVRISQCNDSLIYLYHNWINNTLPDDTARKNNAGIYVFEGSEPLEQGLYFISGIDKWHKDFFVTSNQRFDLEYDLSDPTGKLNTSSSKENESFFKIIAELKSKILVMNPARSDSTRYIFSHTDYTEPGIRELFRFKTGDSLLFQKYILACVSPADYQEYFSPGKTNSKVSDTRYYLDHFFDNLDFKDVRMINTPVFTYRINEFLDTIPKIQGISPQSEIDRLLRLSSVNPRTGRFVAWYLITRFETYYFVQGNDALFVHVMNDWLENGKVGWFYPELRSRELKQLKIFEPLLDGKQAPDLEMPDTSGTRQDLYGVKAQYTMLLFWASTCSHCRDEMPSISDFYKEFHKKYDLEIFAVSTDTSITRWKSFIRRHKLPWINVFGRKSFKGSYHLLYDIRSTPVIYLLDERKIIIAKYLTPARAGEIILQREAVKNRKQATIKNN